MMRAFPGIDDDALVRRSLGRQLRSLGFGVDEVSTGDEGLLHLAQHDDVTVVFLDLALGKVAGTEVLAAIRGNHPSLPVFVVSGLIEVGSNLEDASAILTKPVAHDTLVEALTRQLRPCAASA
jgi:CheY-like chemotaxis protein